jgi:hypothetical protein
MPYPTPPLVLNQVKAVKSLLQLGYTAKQISRNLQREPESEKRRLLTKPELLKERLGNTFLGRHNNSLPFGTKMYRKGLVDKALSC